MKKLTALFLIALLSAVMLIPVAAEGVALGDINGDSAVNAADARLALRFSAKIDIPDEAELAAADVNQSGDVTAADARLILRVGAKLDTFPDTVIPDKSDDALPKEAEIILSSYFNMTGTVTTHFEDGTTDDMTVDIITDGYAILFNTNTVGTNFAVLTDGNGNAYAILPDVNCCAMLDEDLLVAFGIEDDVDLSDFLYIPSVPDDPEIFSDKKTVDGTEYAVYSYIYDDEKIELYTLGEELIFINSYYDDVLTTTIIVETITDEIDESVLTAEKYNEVGITTFVMLLLENAGYDDDIYYEPYMDEEFWAQTIDWDAVEATEITEEDIPEALKIIESNNFSCQAYNRSVYSYDDDGIEFYDFYETSLYVTENKIRERIRYSGFIDDTLIIYEKNLLGKQTCNFYLINEANGTYTKIDSTYIKEYIDVYGLQSYNPFAKIGERTLTKKTFTDAEGASYELITATYSELDTTMYAQLRNGELERVTFAYGEFSAREEYIFTYCSAEVDESKLSTRGLIWTPELFFESEYY